MKSFFVKSIFFMLIFSLCFSCDRKEKNEPFLKVSEKVVSFSHALSQKNLKIETNQNWNFTVSVDSKRWLVAVKNGNDALNVKVLKNDAITEREASIVVKSGELTETIKVIQLGTGGSIVPSSESLDAGKYGEDIPLTITANVEYDITFPDWVTKKSEDAQEEVKEQGVKVYNYVLTIAENSENTTRRGTIKIVSRGTPPIQKEIQIIQKGEYANSSNVSAIEGDVKVRIQRGTATSHHNTQGIEKSFDGSMTTIYHSNWNNAPENYFPITIEYFFENPEDVDYMIYYPRTDGSNGHFKVVEIWVSTEEQMQYTKLKEVDFKGNGKATRVSFDVPIKKAKSFKLVVKSGHGDNKGFAAAAEIEFWRKNEKAFSTEAIFTDTSCSELKQEVTEEQIRAIENPFFRDIALFLKNKQYPTEFRIQEYRAWANPELVRRHNKMSYAYSNLDNPTGIAVEEGEELVVLVGPTYGKDISIKIQNLDVPNGDGFGNAAFHPLYEGTNKIVAGKKGLVYLLYQDEDYQNAPKIKVHFATGKVNGYFDKMKHNSADWTRLLNATTSKYFDVVGEKAHLCFEVASFKNYTKSKGKELIDIYDDMVDKTHIFAGTVGDRQMKNRAYFQVMYKGYMYCTSYRTSYNVTTMKEICNPDGLKERIWGPAHEIGHAHQVGPVFKWIGMTECTVNMNSMNVQTAWGVNPRLEKEKNVDNAGRYNNRYEKAYNVLIVPKTAFGLAGDVFCNLVPFWQLNLYFSKVKNDPEFAVKMYEKFRNTPLKENSNTKDGEYQVDFSRALSELTQTDLTSFFEKWGFYKPIDKSVEDYATRQLRVTQEYASKIKNEIKAMGYSEIKDKIEYISDGNWQYFKNKSAVVKGTATKNGQKITTSNYQNVVAYEVYENNQLIFVTNRNSFDIGKPFTSNMVVYAIAYDGTQTQVTF